MATKSTITAFLLFSFTQIFAYQIAPFWQEGFNTGQIPSAWIVEDESSNPVYWQHCSNFNNCPLSELNGLDLFPDVRFQSHSMLDGYVYLMPFTEGGAHRSYLQTPIINCENQSQVFVTFTTFIIARNSVPELDAVLEVRSTNNPQWTSFTVFPHLNQSKVEFDPTFPAEGSKRIQSYNGQFVSIDISAIAAGESQVEIRWKWEWSGEEEYCWLIDDIKLLDDNPLEENVVWGNLPGEGDFDGGLNEWTSPIAPQCNWYWSSDGLLDSPDDGTLADLMSCSQTVRNGVAAMNALCEPEKIPQFTELISPMIDLSAGDPAKRLGLRFNQSGIKGNNNNNFNLPLTSVMVSTNAGATYIDTIFLNLTEPFNKPFCKTSLIPLPYEATGSSEFVFKFVFSGSSFYWTIDDVRIVELFENDLKISEDYYSVAENYNTPAWMIQPMTFSAEAQNIGNLDQDNVELHLNIIEDASLQTVFKDTLLIGAIASGDYSTVIKFPKSFLPQADESYTAFYEVISAEIDQNPDDNIISFRFKTNQNIVSKNKDKYSVNGVFAPEGNFLNYEIGNCYYIPKGGKIAATGMRFAFADPFELYEDNLVLGINLYRWGKGNNKGDVNGDMHANINEFEKVVDTFFQADQQYFKFDIIEVPFPGQIVFDEGTYYFVTVEYFSPVNNYPFFIAASEEVNYAALYGKSEEEDRPAYVSMLRTGFEADFEVNAWGLLRVPYVELMVDGFTGSEGITQIKDHISIYPNPCNNNISIDFTNADIRSGIAYEIYDICGRLAQPRQTVKGYVSHLPIDISQLDNGIYNLQVISENRMIVEQFVVAKNK